MKYLDLEKSEVLALQGLVYKKNYLILLAQQVDSEINDYINELSKKYGKIVNYDIERGKIIVEDENDTSIKEGTG
ncbi:MAG: hypothetical protein QW228_04665 [Candidatus Aenigmatarchaeota archaeon]